MSIMQMLLATSGGGGVNVADVYATNQYIGNGSSKSINNGLDLTTGEALVWVKRRNESGDHVLSDTINGANKYLSSNKINGIENATDRITAFNSNGFSVGSNERVNASFKQYISWTFKSAPGFFDIVSYTGTSSTLNVSHNLGVVPGCIIVKNLDNNAFYWAVYHEAMGNTKAIRLNETNGSITGQYFWNNTSPTSTQFTVNGSGYTNYNGSPFIAYLFAKDTANLIKCGSYTGNGSGQSINVGFEPQWLMIKKHTATDRWAIFDDVRTFTGSGGGISGTERNSFIDAAVTNAQFDDAGTLDLTSSGFNVGSTSATNTSNEEFFYVAIAAP